MGKVISWPIDQLDLKSRYTKSATRRPRMLRPAVRMPTCRSFPMTRSAAT